jgi:hypothetical protein
VARRPRLRPRSDYVLRRWLFSCSRRPACCHLNPGVMSWSGLQQLAVAPSME